MIQLCVCIYCLHTEGVSDGKSRSPTSLSDSSTIITVGTVRPLSFKVSTPLRAINVFGGDLQREKQSPIFPLENTYSYKTYISNTRYNFYSDNKVFKYVYLGRVCGRKYTFHSISCWQPEDNCNTFSLTSVLLMQDLSKPIVSLKYNLVYRATAKLQHGILTHILLPCPLPHCRCLQDKNVHVNHCITNIQGVRDLQLSDTCTAQLLNCIRCIRQITWYIRKYIQCLVSPDLASGMGFVQQSKYGFSSLFILTSTCQITLF